jgi:hypothetical protein
MILNQSGTFVHNSSTENGNSNNNTNNKIMSYNKGGIYQLKIYNKNTKLQK